VAWKHRVGLDDALAVWGVHGVGGALGIVLLGMFATRSFNPASTNGLFSGNPAFFWKQCAAIALSSAWAFVLTYVMLWLINKVTPVRVSATEEEAGLDESL